MVARGMAVALLCSVVFWFGCSTPTERYKVLSFFFDGVPDPNAPVVVKQVEVEATGVVSKVSIASRHKPYVDGKCGSCHRSATGQIMEFEEAYKLCTTCHTKTTTQYAKMHGPVATGSCRWCHTAHESTEVALLKDPPVQVCTQCHDKQLLGPTPPQHMDGTNCIKCHGGHGGKEANFLKPDWMVVLKQSPLEGAKTQPGTQPASQPGTQPSTEPASQPVQEKLLGQRGMSSPVPASVDGWGGVRAFSMRSVTARLNAESAVEADSELHEPGSSCNTGEETG